MLIHLPKADYMRQNPSTQKLEFRTENGTLELTTDDAHLLVQNVFGNAKRAYDRSNNPKRSAAYEKEKRDGRRRQRQSAVSNINTFKYNVTCN